jgi:hypothetical protein
MEFDRNANKRLATVPDKMVWMIKYGAPGTANSAKIEMHLIVNVKLKPLWAPQVE